MEAETLFDEVVKIGDPQAKLMWMLAAAISPEHVWYFAKMHYDWEQSVCMKCGAMRIVRPNGMIQFKARGSLRWNPFARLQSTIGPCKVHKRAPLHPKKVMAEFGYVRRTNFR